MRLRGLAAALALPLAGCGSLLRVEAGPTWIGDAPYATAQAVAGLPIVAGYGIYDALTVGGWVTARPGDVDSAGLLFGCQFGTVPGGPDQGRGDKTRSGLAATGRFQPRFSSAGLDFGGGIALGWGTGARGSESSWSSSSHEKSGLSVDWSHWRYDTIALGVDLARRLGDDGFEAPGPWRVDALVALERLWVTD